MKKIVTIIGCSLLVVFSSDAVKFRNGLEKDASVEITPKDRPSVSERIEAGATTNLNIAGQIAKIEVREFKSGAVGGPVTAEFIESGRINSPEDYMVQGVNKRPGYPTSQYILHKELNNKGMIDTFVVLPKRK